MLGAVSDIVQHLARLHYSIAWMDEFGFGSPFKHRALPQWVKKTFGEAASYVRREAGRKEGKLGRKELLELVKATPAWRRGG